MKAGHLFAPALAGLLACACAAEEAARDTSQFDRAYQHALMDSLLDAQPGDVIEIPAGNFLIERGLSLTVDDVTIRGQGMDATVLSFAEQRQGAEGLLVSGADNFTIENLAIEDTVGDALKITDGDNIVIRGVRVEWTNGPSTENGAYGLYPVQSTDVLIEDSVAIGASDAGVYVGQSDRIIVRNNRAEYNVAGIEIENSNHADVYGNIATNNTGGILVFNMPHLPRPGAGARVHDNDVFENNTANFGHAGTPVASVPAGAGIIINANDDVHIFNNRLRDNRTGHVVISSYYSSGFEDLSRADAFNPYPEGIWVHDNTYEGGGGDPDAMMLQAARIALFGPTGQLPPVIWDGYVDAAYAEGL
ncbi:MAG: parallel beta-helix domain-containing protein, partial [Oceanicaulis sp.]